MLQLRANLDDLRVTTGAAAAHDIEVHRSAVQVDASTPPVVQPMPDLGPLASITTATTTLIIDTSGITNGHTVNVGNCSIFNRHATNSCLITVDVNDGTLTTAKAECTLLAGEHLDLTQGGVWVHYDANGGVYPAQPPFATQAEMEAASALDKIVTPGRQHFHPAVAKFIAMTTGTATPSLQTPPTYNVTSITDNGVGDLTVTIATDFSSASWCCLAMCEPISVTFTAIANVMRAAIRFGGIAAGTIRLTSLDWSATTNVIRDPITWHVVGWGDQA